MVLNSLILRQTFRQLKQFDISRTIGLGGLLIGVFALGLSLLLYSHETGYEDWLENPDRIFRVEIDLTNLNGGGEDIILPTSPPALASALQSNIRGVRHATRLVSLPKNLHYAPPNEDITVTAQFLDETFFEVFPFPVIAGSAQEALADPMRAIMTQDEALRVFGSTDVVGRTIELDNGVVLTVGAVLADLPTNTHFRFRGLLLPITSPLSGFAGTGDDNWLTNNALTYVETHGKHSKASLEQETAEILKRLSPLAKFGGPGDSNYPRVRVLPVNSLHLHPESGRIAPDGMKDYGNGDLVKSFLYISVMLIFICLFNITNIEISKIGSREKSFYIHKIYGAKFSDLL